MPTDPQGSAACVFCQRVQDEDYDWSTAYAVSFVPWSPVAPGHRLVVPRVHVKDFMEDPLVSAQTMRAAAQLAQEGGGTAYNVITSAGRAATQTVFHLHLHLVPRAADDGLRLPWGRRDRHYAWQVTNRNGEVTVQWGKQASDLPRAAINFATGLALVKTALGLLEGVTDDKEPGE